MPVQRRTCSPSRLHYLRIGVLAVLALVGVLLALLGAHQALLPLLAWFVPQLETVFYDLAVYGAYRTQSHVSFDLSAARTSVVQWHDSCDDGLVFLGPYGPSVPMEGPVIMTPRGGLVWTTDEFGHVTNFQMQTYRGQNYLTFWAGRKLGGVGEGAFHMLDERYNVVYTVRAVGAAMYGDLHEFQITDEGTALITVYNKTNADLRPMGLFRPKNGWILDSVFQEIDIETGELLFEWAASAHSRPEMTHYAQPFAGYISSLPFDFYHINSIQKDSKGNYLISSRHMFTLTYIDGSTGDVLWTLGGGSEDFTDLSDGRASDFKWQHHARWASEEEGLISLFDNGVAGILHVDTDSSKGLLIQLDLQNRTATHLSSFRATHPTLSSSQGSTQVRDSRVFVGWGSSALWTEHEMDGTLLCEVHFGASCAYWWERVKSYRSFKASGWVGRPASPPQAKLSPDGRTLFVSWNGATEVRYWELQGERDGDFVRIEVAQKRGFEAEFVLPIPSSSSFVFADDNDDDDEDAAFVRYRVAALDVDWNVLRHSDPVERDESGSGWSTWGVLTGVCAGIALVGAGVWYVLRVWRHRPRSRAGAGAGVGLLSRPLEWDSPAIRLWNWDSLHYSKL